MQKMVLIMALLLCPQSWAVLSASSCKAKIRAAHLARTGQNLDDSTINNLLDLCQGIIDAIKADAVVQSGIPVSTTGSASAQTGSTTGTGSIQ